VKLRKKTARAADGGVPADSGNPPRIPARACDADRFSARLSASIEQNGPPDMRGITTIILSVLMMAGPGGGLSAAGVRCAAGTAPGA
jgi:hypothetical protein